MKKVYFIRHGESTGNVDPSSKEALSYLTSLGEQQSQNIAKQCTSFSIEKIIAGTMLRAKQTADIIAKGTNLPVESSHLFVERRKPTEQDGIDQTCQQAILIKTMIKENFTVPKYRFSDEENFSDLKARARSALRHLEAMPENSILVVTHDFFMRVLVSYVIFGDRLTSVQCQHIVKKFRMKHAGITTMHHDDRDSSWSVQEWNNSSHLL